MKNKVKHLAAMAIAILMLATNTVMAKQQKFDTTHFVVNGIILKTDNKLNSKCKLELFHENKVIDSSIIKLNKPFQYKLKKNVWYTLRVTKEGFLPLTISFNTELGNDLVLDNLFTFETALISKEEAKSLNSDLIDFPVGIVAYNKQTGKFEARDNYTDNYLSGLYKVEVITADIAKEYVNKGRFSNTSC